MKLNYGASRDGDDTLSWTRPCLSALIIALAIQGACAAAAATVTRDTTRQSVTADMLTLPARVVGRTSNAALPPPLPAGATAYTHEWPGVYFETAFIGDRLVLRFDDGWHEYRLRVDNDPPIAVTRPGQADIVVGGLAWGPHRIRLEKVSESFKVRGTFAGFYAPRDARPLPVPASARQIEFIGPSGMTGFGNRSTTPTCTFDDEHATTDTQQAYTALVAKHFGADYQINASSGRGLIRNVAEIRGDPGLLALYPFTFSDLTGPYADPSWRPQIVEIAALTDFMIELRPDERWKDLKGLIPDWTKAFGDLLAEIHRRSPDAAILVDWPEETDINPPEYRKTFADLKAAMGQAADRAGVRTILFVPPYHGQLERTGCGQHGSLKDNQAIAEFLIGYIGARPELWNGR